MIRQIIAAVLITTCVIAGFAFIKYRQVSSAIATAMSRKEPAQAVTTFVATQEEWPRFLSAVGTIRAVEGTTLSAQDAGRISVVRFQSGSYVQKGSVLVELDTDVEKADLSGAVARLELAELTAKRQRTLRERAANSQSDSDVAEAGLRDARAQVERLKAIIERKTIIAPFSGRSGIRLVNPGQMVSPGTAIVALYAFDPLFLDFSLPQHSLGDVTIGCPVKLHVDAFPERTFDATLSAMESFVDPITRNIDLQATLRNVDQVLRPGMFANVDVVLPTKDRVVAVPSSSVSYALYGDTIYLVEKNAGGALIASPRTIKLGRRLGDRIAVLSGISPGDEIVTSGTFKLRPGVSVSVNNEITPENELNPTPQER